MSADAATLPVDPSALMRSRQYRALLVFAALVGLLVSALAWLFLEAVHALQIEVYTKLPGTLASTRCRPGGRFRGSPSPGCSRPSRSSSSPAVGDTCRRTD